MRLTQPFRGWQLAFVMFVVMIPLAASAQMLDSTTRTQALESSDFPRGVALVGELPPTLTEQEWDAGIATAVASWNDVSCSDAELEWIGRFDTIAEVPQDATAVAFVDSDADRCFALPNDIGWTLLTPCDDWPATTVMLNLSHYTWSAEPAPYQEVGAGIVDLTSVLTHELGHVLGLHHEDVDDPLATMTPRYLLDGGLATLSAQDKLALCGAHPGGVSECSGDSDCGDAVCVSDDTWAVCQEPRAGIGDLCDGNISCEAASGDSSYCFATSWPTDYSGYCTVVCVDDDGCPGDMVCDETVMECRFDGSFSVGGGGGCATTSADRAATNWLCLGVILLGATRVRRRRAGTRSP